MVKKSKKKQVKKIKEIKSKIKEIKPELKKQEEEESEVEEKLEDAEEESSDSSFMRFIQKSKTLSIEEAHRETQELPQLPGTELLKDVSSSTKTKNKEENIEEYVVSTPEHYKEFARQQNVHSFEQTPEEILHTRSIGFDENIGRQRQIIEREAHLINPEEIMGIQQRAGAEDYDIVKPTQTGFTKESESSTIPFQNPKKTYEENV